MKKIVLVLGLLALVTLGRPVTASENQIVAGAGPSTHTAELFFDFLARHPAAAGYNFIVMETSVKHKGGIKNSDSYVFGRTGRPLSDAERSLGKDEIFLAKVPIAFAKGLEVDVASLSMEQIRAIFTRRVGNWREVGGPDAPILLVGREPTEALFSVLKEDYPFFAEVAFDRIFKKDHEVINFLSSPAGRHAIAFGAKPNLADHNQVEVHGFDSGVRLGLVYDLKNAAHPLVEAARDAAQSREWRQIVAGTQMRPL